LALALAIYSAVFIYSLFNWEKKSSLSVVPELLHLCLKKKKLNVLKKSIFTGAHRLQKARSKFSKFLNSNITSG